MPSRNTIEVRITGSNQAGPSLDSLNRGLANMGKQADQAQSRVRGLGSALSGMGGMAASFAAGGLLGNLISQAFSAAGDAILGFNARLEQSKIGWTTMLQSADAAKIMMDDLYNLAARTPFEFAGLEKSARLLLGMGFGARDVIPMMTDVGNAVASVGGGEESISAVVRALGQMKMAGRVNAQDMNQLTNALIPGWTILAEYIGKPVSEIRKMSEEGKIASATFIAAFNAWARAPKIGTMMEQQSKTFIGSLSTIKDVLRSTAATAFEPLFARISGLTRSFGELAAGGGLSQLASTISSTISRILSIIDSIPAPIRNAAMQFGAMFVAMAGGVGIIGMLAGVLGGLLSPIGAVIGIVALLFAAWQGNWLGIRDLTASVLPWILDKVMTVIGAVVGFVEDNMGKVQEIIDRILNWLQNAWATAGDNLMEIVDIAWTTIQNIIGRVLDTLSAIIGTALAIIRGDWTGAWQGLKRILGNAWLAMIDIVTGGARIIMQAVDAVGKAFGFDLGGSELFQGIDALLQRARDMVTGLTEATLAVDGAAAAGYRYADSTARGKARVESLAASIRYSLLPATQDATIAMLYQEQAVNRGNAALDANQAAANAAATANAGAVPAVAALGTAAKEASISVSDLVSALVATHPAVLKLQAAQAGLRTQIANVTLAIQANQDQVKAAQADYKRMQDRLTGLQETLAGAQARLEAFSRPQLTGMGKGTMQIDALQAQLKRIELAKSLGVPLAQIIAKYPLLTKGAEGYLRTVQPTEDAVNKVLEQLQLAQSLSFDEKMRLLEQASQDAVKEMDFKTAMAGVIATKNEITGLTVQITAQEAAMRSQQLVIDSIQAAGEALNTTQRNLQAQLALTDQALDLVTKSLTEAYTWLMQDRQKMLEMGGEAVTQAGVVDVATMSLLASLDTYATDVAGTVQGTLNGIIAAYEEALRRAMAIVARFPGVPGGTTTGSTEGRQFGGPVLAGHAYTVGETGIETFVPGVSGNIMPNATGRQSVLGGIDYERLAAAMTRQPLVVQIDGRTIARVTRSELLRTKTRTGDLGLS